MITSPIYITSFLFLFLSLPLLLFISPSFFPNSLFSSSSAAAANNLSHLSSPGKPFPKIAFLFLTNSNLTFSPLWDLFFAAADRRCPFNVYVHADPRCGFSDPLGHFHGRLIPSRPTERGSPSLIAATRRLLSTAILDDPFNFYFAVVSQHCVPLHSFDYIYGALFGNPNGFKSYIEVLSNEPNLHERYVARGERVMLPEVPFEQFRVGSQFFILMRPHALTVVKDRKLWKKFRLPCLNNQLCYPEEHYFPTLLDMTDGDNCSRYTLTRVNWTGCYDGHPNMYQPGEVSVELVRNLRRSEGNYSYFFARKFAPGCLQPLMDLADDVIFRD